MPDSVVAVHQPDAGFLLAERAVAAYVRRARAAGAVITTGESVLDWTPTAGVVRVRTDRASYEAGQLVLAAGAWMGRLMPRLAGHLEPERQVLGWFGLARRDLFTPAAFPIFVLDAPEGLFYGFPEFGVPGLKLGKYHHRSERVDPDAVDRTCGPDDEQVLREAVARYFPDANGPLLDSTVCLFTNTSDGHFILGRHPEAPEVLVVSPCSGHGFKFSSVIGEIVADLVERGGTAHDISLFRLSRLESPG
ncbi:MAG TPA: N-methyl-L-tryptophan oxidase [Vicinamibacterales bacterium]|nr:N-methyl-L-tryptophan oxidase [Vicinamibacterales bacterium]